MSTNGTRVLDGGIAPHYYLDRGAEIDIMRQTIEVPVRGIVPGYVRGPFERLLPIKKKLIEVDGRVFWMVSHPREAATVICDWFDDTL